MASDVTRAVGVDIGGTGIKAGIVDLQKGRLVSDRVKVATPAGALERPPETWPGFWRETAWPGIA